MMPLSHKSEFVDFSLQWEKICMLFHTVLHTLYWGLWVIKVKVLKVRPKCQETLTLVLASVCHYQLYDGASSSGPSPPAASFPAHCLVSGDGKAKIVSDNT